MSEPQQQDIRSTRNRQKRALQKLLKRRDFLQEQCDGTAASVSLREQLVATNKDITLSKAVLNQIYHTLEEATSAQVQLSVDVSVGEPAISVEEISTEVPVTAATNPTTTQVSHGKRKRKPGDPSALPRPSTRLRSRHDTQTNTFEFTAIEPTGTSQHTFEIPRSGTWLADRDELSLLQTDGNEMTSPLVSFVDSFAQRTYSPLFRKQDLWMARWHGIRLTLYLSGVCSRSKRCSSNHTGI